ncbi:hypothetical protein EYF80_058409 [Liparis tanakae]|uniref:Uncharacterized protein n=1 Tax=Liparis tanakae TaxID=230148 RepID=A0A4Z2ERM2_9TELE|nr:hypothetical protein EYF80_058409 [Liparis tanakae]
MKREAEDDRGLYTLTSLGVHSCTVRALGLLMGTSAPESHPTVSSKNLLVFAFQQRLIRKFGQPPHPSNSGRSVSLIEVAFTALQSDKHFNHDGTQLVSSVSNIAVASHEETRQQVFSVHTHKQSALSQGPGCNRRGRFTSSAGRHRMGRCCC